VVEKYVYSGGYFGKFSGKKESAWVESKSDGSAEFHFVEKSRDKNWIQLFDTSRNMTLRLPIKGGMCSWSTDGGRTWNRLYQVVRAK
jgi:hypothetical protein